MDIIVGTAGHIDHGKTALVKALTGTDADRLPEEKQRGITIDLGFAEMSSDGIRIGFVDVPGHERFVKNMLAGASGIDLVLLVVAADEGVMPQTREHFDICRLLRIKSGIVALTKTDLADADTLELAKLDVAELVRGSFLDGAPVFAVSSRTLDGVAELKAGLTEAAKSVRREDEIREPRLAIDRSFSVRGFGAVVTGTLASGEIAEGDELELLPVGRSLRVRGLQTYGRSVTAAHAGQRTAVNLSGISHDEIERGMVLTHARALSVTQVFDAEVEVLKDFARGLRSRQRVRLHLGTAEVLARIAVLNENHEIGPGATGFAQFRLESPVAAASGDRFIVRTYSPQGTVAGGRVLDPASLRHRRRNLENVSARLGSLSAATGDLTEIFVRIAGDQGLRIAEARARTGVRSEILRGQIDEAVRAGRMIDADGVLLSSDAFERLQAKMLEAIEAHHRSDKLSRGISRETLRERTFRHGEPELFRAVTNELERRGKIVSNQDVFRQVSHEASFSEAERKTFDMFRRVYSEARLEVPKLGDALQDVALACGIDAKSARKVFQLLIDSGEVVSVTPEFYFPADVLGGLTDKLREHTRLSGEAIIDVPKFKEIAGVSRKYAIPLLEFFDRTRVTRRVGDKRQIL